MKETRKRKRRTLRGAVEGLRDLRMRLAWRISASARRGADPDDDTFGRFLQRAGEAADPDCDERLMPYWFVTRRVRGETMPEALESAWLRFRGRRRRDPERARIWREYVLKWAELRGDDHAAAGEGGRSAAAADSMSLHEALIEECFEAAAPDARPLEAYRAGRRRRSGRRPVGDRAAGRLVRRSVAAVAVAAVLGLATWISPAGRPATEADMPPVSSLGIEQLERGSKSLVEQALRARYIETLHQVQRLRITEVGEGMDFERILLEGARLDVERAIERHRLTGRVPPRLYLLLGKLSLLTEFETDGRRALARAANHGGAVGKEALELLALLPE